MQTLIYFCEKCGQTHGVENIITLDIVLLLGKNVQAISVTDNSFYPC